MKMQYVQVILPIEYPDDRTMLRFRFYGVVDRRRMRRMMRKTLKPIGCTVPNEVLNLFIKHRSMPIYDGDTAVKN